MTQSPRTNKQTTTRPQKTSHAAILLLSTIADTTWRAFVPTIGGTILGVVLDGAFGSAPVFVIVCITLGFFTSAALIIQQLRRVQRS